MEKPSEPFFKVSFRTKLVMVMALVVAGITVATLTITRTEVRLAYQRMLDAQFRAQMEFFTDQQRHRQDVLTRRCDELARSRELIEGLRRGQADQALTNLISDITNLVDVVRRAETPTTNAAPERPALLSATERRRALERGIVPRLSEQPFVGLLDTNGYFLATSIPPRPSGDRPPGPLGGGKAFGGKRPEPDAAMKGPRLDKGDRDRGRPPGGDPGRRERLRWFTTGRSNVVQLDKQIIGFSMLSTPRGDQQLREAIVTPVNDPDSNQLLGFLLLGYPLPDFAERALVNFSRQAEHLNVLSGVWHERRVFSSTIPTNLQELVANGVSDGLAQGADSRGNFEIEIDGEGFHVFYSVLNPDSPLPKAAVVGLYSLAPQRLQVRALQLQIAFFVLVVFLVALALIFAVSHGLARPLRELVRGTQAIRAGQFDVTVPVRSNDELGELATSFNEMAIGLAQREQLRNALNLVADRDIAEQLINGRIELGGELREVSVLFCDIRGFTAITQIMSPAEVVHLLNDHLTEMTRVVYEHGGVVDKFMGDGVMAVFGAPKTRGDDTFAAARCALDMIAAREARNRTAPQKIHVGIGIATGPVIAGNMGSDNRLNYTVIGERVNLAARLCSQAGRGEVVIDSTTRTQLAERIEAELLPELRLKGFTDAVQAYRLRSIRS